MNYTTDSIAAMLADGMSLEDIFAVERVKANEIKAAREKAAAAKRQEEIDTAAINYINAFDKWNVLVYNKKPMTDEEKQRLKDVLDKMAKATCKIKFTPKNGTSFTMNGTLNGVNDIVDNILGTFADSL